MSTGEFSVPPGCPIAGSASHDFLHYQAVDVHFTYAFWWRSDDLNHSVFRTGFTDPQSDTHRGWRTPFLHERTTGDETGDAAVRWPGAYQPTFVLPRRSLSLSSRSHLPTGSEADITSSREAWLVVPLVSGAEFPKGDEPPRELTLGDKVCTYPVRLSWMVRMFDTRTGVVTITVSARDLDRYPPAIRFALLHWILRLVPNTDKVAQADPDPAPAGDGGPAPRADSVSDAFLYLPGHGTMRLFYYAHFLRDAVLSAPPPDAFRKSEVGRIIVDEKMLAGREPAPEQPPSRYHEAEWDENQVPFTFMVAGVTAASIQQLQRGSLKRAQEIGSLCARLTLDNRRPHHDFEWFSKEYLVSALGFDPAKECIPNLGHDERLFLAFSRRGALACVPVRGDAPGPALFTIPSTLNLFEIARARLLGGLTLGARLAEMAIFLAPLDPTRKVSHEDYAALRSLVVANLQNPLEYLFDGGAVTELALMAQDALFVSQTWEHVRRCFEMVDRLLSAWEAARLRYQYGD